MEATPGATSGGGQIWPCLMGVEHYWTSGNGNGGLEWRQSLNSEHLSIRQGFPSPYSEASSLDCCGFKLLHCCSPGHFTCRASFSHSISTIILWRKYAIPFYRWRNGNWEKERERGSDFAHLKAVSDRARARIWTQAIPFVIFSYHIY